MRLMRLDTPVLPEEIEGENYESYANRVVDWDLYWTTKSAPNRLGGRRSTLS
jgi:hypothetical protein